MIRNTTTLALVAALMLSTAPAFADQDDIDNAKAAKISLTEAIATAEKETSGKAIEASLDDDNAALAYEVSVLKDNKLWDVHVNANSGAVISTAEDND